MKNLLIATAVAGLALPLSAQTVYNDTNQDNSWGNAGNWSAGVPTSTSNVQIGVSPAGELLGIDTGGLVTIASLTINAGVSPGFTFVPLLDETLQVNGAITNLSGSTVTFGIPVTAGANATWDGPLVFANTLNVDARKITATEAISISSGNNLNFQITNATTFGGFTGQVNVTGVTINIFSSFTFSAGQTFDFSTGGNFTGATLGALPALTGGLTWNTESFASDGIISVIPEPSTWALMLGCAALGFTAVRRQRKQA
jgi:hypothetical protein